MAGPWSNLTAGVRRRLGDLTPREQRALATLAAAVVLFVVAVTVYLVQSSLGEKEARNRDQASVLSLVREKGRDHRNRVAEQEELNRRLGTEMQPLPSILGETLAELGQQRQDFQELAPEAIGLPGQRNKPWVRHAVKFPLRKVSALTVYDLLLKLRERYPDLPMAVTKLDMRLDRSEDALYNVELVVSLYRLAEPKRDAAQDARSGRANSRSAGTEKDLVGP
ncbi:MAG: hypothetical protein JXB32_18945 [Deltaproteobacteria bacterium]|nr:hypothetical protein [Deltaproteobacteria bacterium]